MINRSLARANVWQRTRRVLSARLVIALAGPHDVDRYLRMVNPLRPVTMTLRPNANWTGARAGQFARRAPAGGRSSKRAA